MSLTRARWIATVGEFFESFSVDRTLFAAVFGRIAAATSSLKLTLIQYLEKFVFGMNT
jgi:hypothetical protein